MDEKEWQQHTCLRKIRYASKKKALHAMATLKASKKLIPPGFSIYQCRLCKKFHLGNSSIKK